LQFVESSSFGVRSAIYELARPDVPLRFALFSMIHIGEARYYDALAERARQCDVLLLEGVPSLRVRLATYAYRAFSDRLGLVTQAHMNTRQLGVRVLDADLSAEEFDSAHARLPLLARLILPLMLPACALWFRIAGTRALLAASLSREDLASREQILSSSPELDAFDDLVLHRRDRVFLARLREFYEEAHNRPITAGIIYGAGHMPAIARFLLGPLQYRVRAASWAQVFEL